MQHADWSTHSTNPLLQQWQIYNYRAICRQLILLIFQKHYVRMYRRFVMQPNSTISQPSLKVESFQKNEKTWTIHSEKLFFQFNERKYRYDIPSTNSRLVFMFSRYAQNKKVKIKLAYLYTSSLCWSSMYSTLYFSFWWLLSVISSSSSCDNLVKTSPRSLAEIKSVIPLINIYFFIEIIKII